MKVARTLQHALLLAILALLVLDGLHAANGWAKPISELLGSMTCALCKPVIATWMKMVQLGVPVSYTTDKVRKLSHLIPQVSPQVVGGFIDRWQDQLQYILENSDLGAAEVCASLINDCGPRGRPFQWKVALPPRPHQEHHKDARGYDPDRSSGGRVLKVLQIADIHLEPHYTPGSNTACSNKIYCCRAKDGMLPSGHPDAAGHWGSYDNCDTSPALLESMLQHIKLQHPDIDYVMWTGDNSPHDVHETTRSQILSISHQLTDDFLRQLPHVMVLPAVGNHDAHPVNSFPSDAVPPRFSSDWLMHELYDMWKPLVTGPASGGGARQSSFDSTFTKHGYYFVLMKGWGLRYLVLNTNVCYRWNFWSLLRLQDPGRQLRWLVQQLAEAEAAGEHVHILGHLSPGDVDCRFDWSHQYHRIVLRFRKTIAAQFFSHTHLDEFQMSLDERGRAAAVLYISPSVSPWTNVNPGYKIYHVQTGSGEVIDTERWAVDLREANRQPLQEPHWFRLSSARQTYGMVDLLPHSWLQVADRMAGDIGYFNRVYNNYWGNSTERDRCDKTCRRRILCNIVGMDRSTERHCHRISAQMEHRKR